MTSAQRIALIVVSLAILAGGFVLVQGSGDDDAKVTVPSTAATLDRWVSVWLAMCQRPELAWSSMQDDRLAREHFGLATRALRNIKYAAMTGALRRRAQELGVELPDEFSEAAGERIVSG